MHTTVIAILRSSDQLNILGSENIRANAWLIFLHLCTLTNLLVNMCTYMYMYMYIGVIQVAVFCVQKFEPCYDIVPSNHPWVLRGWGRQLTRRSHLKEYRNLTKP